jgi:hypothetical protein
VRDLGRLAVRALCPVGFIKISARQPPEVLGGVAYGTRPSQGQHARESERGPGVQVLSVDSVASNEGRDRNHSAASEWIGYKEVAAVVGLECFEKSRVHRACPASPPSIGRERWDEYLSIPCLAIRQLADDLRVYEPER